MEVLKSTEFINPPKPSKRVVVSEKEGKPCSPKEIAAIGFMRFVRAQDNITPEQKHHMLVLMQGLINKSTTHPEIKFGASCDLTVQKALNKKPQEIFSRWSASPMGNSFVKDYKKARGLSGVLDSETKAAIIADFCSISEANKFQFGSFEQAFEKDKAEFIAFELANNLNAKNPSMVLNVKTLNWCGNSNLKKFAEMKAELAKYTSQKTIQTSSVVLADVDEE